MEGTVDQHDDKLLRRQLPLHFPRVLWGPKHALVGHSGDGGLRNQGGSRGGFLGTIQNSHQAFTLILEEEGQQLTQKTEGKKGKEKKKVNAKWGPRDTLHFITLHSSHIHTHTPLYIYH